MEGLLIACGVVMIVEGVPWFLSPEGYKRLLLRLLPVDNGLLRLLGLTLMCCGLLVVYLVRRGG